MSVSGYKQNEEYNTQWRSSSLARSQNLNLKSEWQGKPSIDVHKKFYLLSIL